MEFYTILLPLGLILIVSKLFCIGCRKIGIPQVLGMLLTGLLLGLFKYAPKELSDLIVGESAMEGIGFIAKIGVILIMFSAGLETDINKIKKTGVASAIITILGVIVPMGLGFGLACLCFGVGSTKQIFANLFYGCILTATSVSVTIATLKEMGKLDTSVGTAIVSSAIIDDIIGVVLLSFIIGLNGGSSLESSNPLANGICKIFGLSSSQASAPWMICLLIVLFFFAVFGFGYLVRKLFSYLDKHEAHHRRLPIFGISICFLFAYCSEKFFSVADITGAFFAGLILTRSDEKNYIDRRSEIISYMLFTPVFFANIGMSLEFGSIDSSFVLFGLLFVLAGIIGKVMGCGFGAKVTKSNMKDSLRVGLGMMVRAEVCLICAQKGVDAGLIGSNIMPFILMLILLTSFITPMLLKLTYKGEINESTSLLKKEESTKNEDSSLVGQENTVNSLYLNNEQDSKGN